MRVNKSRQYRFLPEINLLPAGKSQTRDVGIAPDPHNPPARDSNCLRPWFLAIHRINVAVVQNQVRLVLLYRKKRKRGQRAEKFPAVGLLAHGGRL